MFCVNDLLAFEAVGGQKVIERVLWVSEIGAFCYTIDINKKKAFPVIWKFSDLEEMYRNQSLKIQDDDPYNHIFQKEENLREKDKDSRNKRWAKIESIVSNEPGIYQKHNRGPLIQEAAETMGTSKKLIYQYLILYWQRGKVKNALLPDFFRCGGKGKEKQFGDKRNGRPRKYAQIMGEGVAVTEDIKRIFEVSIKKFYHKTKNNPLAFSYEQMIRNFFVLGYRYEEGIKMPILKDPKELPTMKQFRYWFKKTYSNEENNQKRKGMRKSALENRVRLGTSVSGTDGPGTRFQIDATVADVYLVNSFNIGWKIGRPVVYLVIDSFSRMVVGVYVGLEGPSWLGAMMALVNTASDKVAYCKSYGIEIKKEEWPCQHLPQVLLGDRGELEGFEVESLSTAFKVKVENAAPYRADWKGIVERHFRTIQTSVKPFMPGTVDKEALSRGDRHPNLDSKLTLEDFTKIIILSIIQHNNHHWLSRYKRDKEMIEADVKPIPINLWEWGIRNKFGILRTFPEDIVKLNLMPSDNATVTSQGIKFKSMHYTSDRAIMEGWYDQATESSWRIPIQYDPRDMSQIYLPSDEGRDYDVAKLKQHFEEYKEKTLVEVENYHVNDKIDELTHKPQERQKKSDIDSRIEDVVKVAKRRMAKKNIKISKRQQLQGVRGYRKYTKEERRLGEAVVLGKQKVVKMKIDKKTTVEKIVSPIPQNEIFRRVRKEKMEHGRQSE